MPCSSLLSRRRTTQRAAALACLAAAALCTGCYNGQTLIERARNNALRTRVETVDLGHFSITMPREDGIRGTTEVQVEPFGRTVRYKVAGIEDQIEERNYSLRQSVMVTIRSSEPEDFSDPDLSVLRDRLLASVQEALGDDAISSIGFHEVRFIRH